MVRLLGRKGFVSLLSVAAIGFTVASPAMAKVKVAMITSESGLGDRSFNDMMNEGMKRAQKELGIDYVVIQPRSISDFQPTLVRAANQGFDIIIGSSFDMIKPMQAVAAAFPTRSSAWSTSAPIRSHPASTERRPRIGKAHSWSASSRPR